MSTALGPLTTEFIPPSTCTSSAGIQVIVSPGCGDDRCTYWVAGANDMAIADFPCFPPRYNPTMSNYYSPGLSCPVGYTTACTGFISIDTVTETIHTCCPESLGYQFTCIAPGERVLPWHSTLNCHVSLSEDVIGSTRTFEDITIHDLEQGISFTSATERLEAGIGAYGVEIRYQGKDVIAATTSRKTEGVVAVPTIPRSGSIIPTATSSSNTGTRNSPSTTPIQRQSNTLSTAATIGIGVGAAVGLCMLIAAMGYMTWVKRRRRLGQVDPVELEGKPPRMTELQNRSDGVVAELSAYNENNVKELAGGQENLPRELPS